MTGAAARARAPAAPAPAPSERAEGPRTSFEARMDRLLPDRGTDLPEGKQMLYCVGAQKAGTSWLGAYLSAHPACHFFIDKEVHYFDAVHLKGGRQAARVARMVRNRARRFAQAEGPARAGALRRLRRAAFWLEMYREGEAGRRGYLANLLNGAGEARYLCDLTPSYQLLPEEGFRDMAGIGARPKFLFLMREPVDRMWSQIRMDLSRAGVPDERIAEKGRAVLERRLGQKDKARLPRGDYRRTVRRLDAAVPAEDLLVLFYEDLFSQETADRLCDFLEIGHRPADFSVVHGGVPAPFPEDLRGPCRDLFARQYGFVARRFGDRVPAVWQAHGPEEGPR